jgi:hypothetical protein
MSDYQYSDLEVKLRDECEHGFDVGPKFHMANIPVLNRNGAAGPTSETFTEMMCRGESESEAYQEALRRFRNYAEGKTGTLFWRVYPEIAACEGEWRAYMRLLISNKGLALVEEMS